MLAYEYFDREANEDGDMADFEIVIGTADEIRRTYDLMVDHCDDIDLYPLYADKPILVDGREYGLVSDFNERRFHVIKADIAEEVIQEYGMNVRGGDR